MTEKTWKKWSEAENKALLRETKKHKTLSSSFMAYAASTGRTVSSISQHYDKIKKDVHLNGFSVASTQQDNVQNEGVIESKKGQPWEKEEDDRLLRQIKAFPGNISWCCMIVAEEIGRSKTACLARWYSILSKRPDVIVNWNITEKTVMRNRKNGKGIESNSSIWRRVMAVLRSLHF